jgi:ABC-type transport system involved in multi-copper enzyme maturation permease subunit
MSGGSSDLPAVKVGVVNLDVPPADAPADIAIGASIHDMFFDDSVKSWLTAVEYPDESAARAAVDSQEIGVAVVIPEGLTETMLFAQHPDGAASGSADILVIQDPTLTITPVIVRSMISSFLEGVAGGGTAFRVISDRIQANGQSLDPAEIPDLLNTYSVWYTDFQRDLFHHPEKAALVVVAPSAGGPDQSDPLSSMVGSIFVGQMIFFAFYTGAYAMTSILREEEEGTLARLFTTPTDRTNILSGKFVAVFLTVVLQGLVLMAVAHYAFGVTWGEPAAVALTLVGQVIAAAGLGVLLISYTKTTKQAGPMLGGVLTTLGMLSGLFTSNMNMPEAFTRLSFLTPQGWVMKGWTLTLAGLPAAEVLLPFTVMTLMGVVMFAFGAVRFRRRFA